MNDALLLDSGIKILINNLGVVEAERFLALINREQFDYTKWQSTLFEGMTVREISKMAMEHREKNVRENIQAKD